MTERVFSRLNMFNMLYRVVSSVDPPGFDRPCGGGVLGPFRTAYGFPQSVGYARNALFKRGFFRTLSKRDSGRTCSARSRFDCQIQNDPAKRSYFTPFGRAPHAPRLRKPGLVRLTGGFVGRFIIIITVRVVVVERPSAPTARADYLRTPLSVLPNL